MASLVVKSIEELSNAARDEIGETQAGLFLARKQVRDILSEKFPDLLLPPDVDDLIDSCLRSRKFDIDSAVAQANYFFKFLLELYEMVGKDISYFLPSTHNKVYYEPQGYVLLRHMDHLGRTVFTANFEKIPAHIFNLDEAVAAAILMALDLTRKSVDVQRLGIVFVLNMTGFKFGHAKHFRVDRIRMIAKIIQGSFPVRIKGIHFVNCSKIISMLYAMIKPFLGRKMRNRIHFYGSDLTNFHEHLFPDILPHFLRGHLPDNDFADVEFSNRLVLLDDYYTEAMKYGYMKI